MRGRTASPSIPASPPPRPAKARSPSSTATRASCSTAATRSTSWRRTRSFLEVCYLLLNGELPNGRRILQTFEHTVTHATPWCTDQFNRFFTGLPIATRRPMAIMVRSGRRVVGLLPRFSTNIHDLEGSGRSPPFRLIAKMPTIAAQRLTSIQIGQPFVYPKQRSQLHRELPAHVLLGAGGRLSGPTPSPWQARYEPPYDPAGGS